jgi:D-alanyl-D-alanine carboxypeptidase (penicillin-binding protein 5/6)
MRNETFRKIVGTASMDLPADEDSPARYLRNKNRLLWQYEGGNGVKTGYTDATGKCLVGGAERDGMQLISVVLNDRSMLPDTMKLLDYGFDVLGRSFDSFKKFFCLLIQSFVSFLPDANIFFC